MKQIPKEIPANDFIKTVCVMKPMSRLGLRSLNSHVYNAQDRLIGYYNPIRDTFSRVGNYTSTFSASLIDRILEG